MKTPIRVFENPQDNCPYNHPQSKFFAQFPAQHIQICICKCNWCQRAFGIRGVTRNLRDGE